jgi:hypothetical protein
MNYIAYVIKIPQQENKKYSKFFQNDYIDHWYNSTDVITPWVFKAKFYLTKQDAEKSLGLLKYDMPDLIAGVNEVRLQVQ